MRDLKQLIAELSERPVTRRQFLGIVAGSFLGVSGFLRYIQDISTPAPETNDLASSDFGVFGEREYGYPVDAEEPSPAQIKEDEFQ